jgi:hypothetical protein
MLTHRDAFPTTDWGLLKNLRGHDPELRSAGLNILAGRYWRPVYCFLMRSGHNDASAKDLTQAFFAEWIESDGFAKADPDKRPCKLPRQLSADGLTRAFAPRRATGGLVRKPPASAAYGGESRSLGEG